MQALTGAVVVAAALLVLAGVPKIAAPTPTTAALRAVGLGFVTRTHVRLLAVVEVAVGILTVLFGGIVLTAAVAAFYLAFSLFLVRALRPSSGATSCGCSGRADTPPTYAHLALTGGLALLAAACAFGGGANGVADLVGPTGDAATTEGVLVGLYAAIGTWLGWVVLNELPRLRALRPAHED